MAAGPPARRPRPDWSGAPRTLGSPRGAPPETTAPPASCQGPDSTTEPSRDPRAATTRGGPPTRGRVRRRSRRPGVRPGRRSGRHHPRPGPHRRTGRRGGARPPSGPAPDPARRGARGRQGRRGRPPSGAPPPPALPRRRQRPVLHQHPPVAPVAGRPHKPTGRWRAARRVGLRPAGHRAEAPGREVERWQRDFNLVLVARVPARCFSPVPAVDAAHLSITRR